MRGSLVLLLLALACVPVYADSLVGADAPPVDFETWLAAPDGNTMTDLRGRVLVLLTGGACDLADEARAQRWNDLRAAWFEKGLRVVAVLGKQPEADLPRHVEFSVAVGAVDDRYGAGPHAALVGADGKVAWHGPPGDLPEEQLVKLLRKTKRFVLPALDPAVAEAVKLFGKGSLLPAHDLALETGHEDGKRIAERVTTLLGNWKRQSERSETAGNKAEMVLHLKHLAKYGRGHVEADDAEVRLVKLKADKSLGKEVSAAKTYTRLRADWVKTKGKRKKIDALVKKAERFAERYAGTRGATRAARLAAAIKADPALTALRAFIAKEKVKAEGSGWRTRLPKPPQVAFAAKRDYLWHLETSQGPITLRFFPESAPMHVSSMLYLTELGFFDGLTFHRVIPGFMAQGGCPSGTGSGDPGYKFDGEFDPARKHDRPGILSAAHSGPGTDASQFFITFGPASHLDGKHTVYGEVVDGLKTLKRIEKLGSTAGATKQTITIEKATIRVE